MIVVENVEIVQLYFKVVVENKINIVWVFCIRD